MLNKTPAQLFLVFILSLTVIALQLSFIEKETPYADNITNLSLALPLYETGVYTDGTFTGTVLPPGPKGEGMFFAPGYAAFLAGIMQLSPGLIEAARCSIEHIKPPIIEEKCALDFTLFWITQAIIGAIGTIFIWLAALALFNQKRLAWLAVILITTAGTFAYYASIVMAEALILPLFFVMTYFLIIHWQKRKWWSAALCGLCFGLLILTKPSYIYLLYFMIVCGIGTALYETFKFKTSAVFKSLLIGLTACALLTAPWINRNHAILGVADITYGYGPFTLSQRVAYNDMSTTEWLAGWVYGIPSIGDEIAEKFLPEDTWKRWSWDDPEGFYTYGNRVLRAQTLEEAGSHEAQLSYLLKNYVLADLPKHIAVTFPLIFRGMWVFELWAFIPYLCFLILCVWCLKQRRYDYLLYAIPGWFMLGLHGFATVNIPRYNVIMQASLGIALAWALLWIWDRYRLQKNTQP